MHFTIFILPSGEDMIAPRRCCLYRMHSSILHRFWSVKLVFSRNAVVQIISHRIFLFIAILIISPDCIDCYISVAKHNLANVFRCLIVPAVDLIRCLCCPSKEHYLFAIYITVDWLLDAQRDLIPGYMDAIVGRYATDRAALLSVSVIQNFDRFHIICGSVSVSVLCPHSV